MNGKGSTPRPANRAAYERGYRAIRWPAQRAAAHEAWNIAQLVRAWRKGKRI